MTSINDLTKLFNKVSLKSKFNDVYNVSKLFKELSTQSKNGNNYEKRIKQNCVLNNLCNSNEKTAKSSKNIDLILLNNIGVEIKNNISTPDYGQFKLIFGKLLIIIN
jgi:hypothetical protein